MPRRGKWACRIWHALTHGPVDRFEKDFGDILGLIRHTGLSPDSPSLREVMEWFGTAELLGELREQFELRGRA